MLFIELFTWQTIFNVKVTRLSELSCSLPYNILNSSNSPTSIRFPRVTRFAWQFAATLQSRHLSRPPLE